MRTLTLLVLMALTFGVNAQITISATAGINTTHVHAANVPGETHNWGYRSGAGLGWQATVRTEFQLNNDWLIYTGAGVDKRYFYRHYDSYDDQGIYYKPLYVTVPAGFGRNIAFTKNIGLHLYAGIYATMGVGGRFHNYMVPGWCEMSCPETPYYDGTIKYGGSSINSTGQLTRFSWGGQVGAGLMLFNSFELAWMYNGGFSNMIRRDYNVNYYRLRATSLDVKVKLATLKAVKGK